MIARGPAGDCCILCGKVGINLPEQHGCVPDVEMPELIPWDSWKQPKADDNPFPTISRKAVAASIAGLLDAVADAPEGQRNHVLYWAACRVVESDAKRPEAIAALTEAAQHAGLNTREIAATIRSAGLHE